MIGLKKGTVDLCEHDILWEINAQETIKLLKKYFGNIALDIQHIGSTSIYSIKAKPIIDILVGITDYNLLHKVIDELKNINIIYKPFYDKNNNKIEFLKIDDLQKNTNTHAIHIVKHNNKEWHDYINFRDYLNNNQEEAKKYESLKIKLMLEYRNDREKYSRNKDEYITKLLEKINNRSNPNLIENNIISM